MDHTPEHYIICGSEAVFVYPCTRRMIWGPHILRFVREPIHKELVRKHTRVQVHVNSQAHHPPPRQTTYPWEDSYGPHALIPPHQHLRNNRVIGNTAAYTAGVALHPNIEVHFLVWQRSASDLKRKPGFAQSISIDSTFPHTDLNLRATLKDTF